ncbi:EamA family transporter [Homoserinibacter sp. GY 40078]|nr:EamA family transporter [Homoserinibacter sp. GY 40078]
MSAAPRGLTGVLLGLSSALAFGAGGSIVKPLFSDGWSPAAAVLARVTVAAIVLAVPGIWAIRGRMRVLWNARWLVLLYATLAVAGTQLAFYAAIERIPVSIGLLIEYLAPVMLLLLMWARTRRRPHPIVLVGAALALGGLVLVIGPSGSGALDPLGVMFAALAMIGVAVYYVIGDRPGADMPPVTLAWAGFVIAALVLGVAGVVGITPLEASFGEVGFFGGRAPWWVPVLVVGVISTAFAYVAGITAITRLGTRVASFLGLSEVVFAGIVGWIVLGEAIGPVALAGAALILGGIVLVRMEPASEAPALAEPLPLTEPIAVVAPVGDSARDATPSPT